MYLFQKIKNGLELYSIEQGRQTVDFIKPLSNRCKIYTVDKYMLKSKRCIAGYTLRLLFSFQEIRVRNI